MSFQRNNFFLVVMSKVTITVEKENIRYAMFALSEFSNILSKQFGDVRIPEDMVDDYRNAWRELYDATNEN